LKDSKIFLQKILDQKLKQTKKIKNLEKNLLEKSKGKQVNIKPKLKKNY